MLIGIVVATVTSVTGLGVVREVPRRRLMGPVGARVGSALAVHRGALGAAVERRPGSRVAERLAAVGEHRERDARPARGSSMVWRSTCCVSRDDGPRGRGHQNDPRWDGLTLTLIAALDHENACFQAFYQRLWRAPSLVRLAGSRGG